MSKNNMPSQRQMRYGEIIRSIVSNTLLKDLIYEEKNNISSITVSFVKMSKDLRIASVFIMPLGGHDKYKVLDILNENKFLFQRALAEAKLKSKFTPRINFFIDDSFEEAEKIEKLLLNKKVLRDIKNE